MSNAVLQRHQQRVHVLEALEFALVDLVDDATKKLERKLVENSHNLGIKYFGFPFQLGRRSVKLTHHPASGGPARR